MPIKVVKISGRAGFEGWGNWVCGCSTGGCGSKTTKVGRSRRIIVSVQREVGKWAWAVSLPERKTGCVSSSVLINGDEWIQS